ncbi:hypothetical protein [Lactobacillus ultunensis]|uniref:Uncharacterized protein n=1 Tax=Lactobacillus ultunensis DSM 16047 TaxID=525365 RepID=C2EPM6_9LACO|nr:hypothetical protein [Lactobacillus ultunensis]EEJ71498.1 hypothetical protein HMPREF0548_1622 [Lactobacillus ultunensis DSM 16047]KRL79796.1 hypothetical protein FC57_GL001770 [Lactobacillus ultunensis DSM 16047]QQP28305.1 hypothetical protein H4B44_09455 [Lactobacillus ultunensis]
MKTKMLEESNSRICYELGKIKEVKNDEYEKERCAQNIASDLRNLVEAIIREIYAVDNNKVVNHRQEFKEDAEKYVKSQSKYRELIRIHDLFQSSFGHFDLNQYSTVRLLITSYYTYLRKIKKFINIFLMKISYRI